MSPSPVTPRTRPASSTRSLALTRKSASSRARSTSPLPPAAARAVPCTRITWLQAPASYGMTDTMGRMHSDAQFAGSSSVPAHVEMMGFLGMGNNPMVGATVAVAVAVEEALKG